MDRRARQHFQKALFHLGVAFEIELILQPDAEGEEPKRPVTAIGKGGGNANGNLVLYSIGNKREV